MVEIDTSGFDRTVADLQAALIASGGDAENLMAGEAARLAKKIGDLTPPYSQEQGNAAVEKGIVSLFSEARQDLIDREVSKHGSIGIDSYVEGQDGQPLHLLWGEVVTTQDRMRSLHLKSRDRKGRVPKIKASTGTWLARAIVPVGMRGPYLQKIKAHVGRWKASWMQVAAEVGRGTGIPPWVKKHFPTPKAISNISGLKNPDGPSIEFGSRAPGNFREHGRIRDAMRERMEIIKRRIGLIASGYAKDVAQGMRIRNKTNNWD